MAKKYSKYNVYQGCSNMCNLKEAMEAIDAGEYTDENMYELEARITLYNKLFRGISNTEVQKRNFNERKEFILRKQTDDEKEEYLVNLQNAIAELEEEASKEFLERTNDINLGSTAGKEAGTPAYDKKTSTQMTRYSKLNNLPVPLNYKCTDEGVFVYSNTEYDYVRICQAVTIVAINNDEETSTQFIELEYFENETSGKIVRTSLPAEELSVGKYMQLIKAGFSISNQKLFTRFLNDLRTCGIKNKAFPIRKAALSYGYPAGESGLDLTKFIGIDDDCRILPMPAFEAYDKTILHSKGTLEEYNAFLTEVSRGKYQTDFQMLVAASLSSIVQAYISADTGRIAPATYVFTGRSSIGKNILANIASSIWCKNGVNNLITNSGSSAAFAAAMKDRLKFLPFIVADIQDLMNKGEDGLKGFTQIVFEHSLGCSSGRATTSGEVRNNKKVWFNCLIAFNENDSFSHNSKITGGGAARMTILPLGIQSSDKWLTEKDPNSYWNLQRKASGVLGKAFVLAMRGKNQDEICDRFYAICSELKNDFGVQEKQALSLAMLVLTDELAMNANLLPAEWEPLTSERLIRWIGGAKKVCDMNEELYKLVSELTFKDTSFVANDDASWKACIKANGGSVQAAFDSRYKDKNEVRGRKLYQKRDASGNFVEGTRNDHDRTLLLIPRANLTQLVNYIKKTYDIIGTDFDPRSWMQNGWLIPSGENTFVHKDTFKISVTFERNSKHRESYYVILLDEDSYDNEVVTDKKDKVNNEIGDEAAIVYESICLETMKHSLSIDAEVNRAICESCTDEKCIFVKRKKDA